MGIQSSTDVTFYNENYLLILTLLKQETYIDITSQEILPLKKKTRTNYYSSTNNKNFRIPILK